MTPRPGIVDVEAAPRVVGRRAATSELLEASVDVSELAGLPV